MLTYKKSGVDIGLADNEALRLALAAKDAVDFLGVPEGELAMVHAVIYLATAPKSNSVLTAAHAARDEVRRTGPLEIPLRIRNAPTGLMKDLGYGQRYRYPHDEPGHVARGERYLPDGVAGGEFYSPGDNAFEQRAIERLRQLGAWPPRHRK